MKVFGQTGSDVLGVLLAALTVQFVIDGIISTIASTFPL